MQKNQASETSPLSYQIVAKQQFAVVSLMGMLSRLAVNTLESCQDEVLRAGARFIVFNFGSTEGLERPLIAALVRLQKVLRDNAMEVRLCHLKPDVRKQLAEAGAIRDAEVHETLQQALASCLATQAKTAA